MYSIEELDRIVLSKRLPKVDKISLKLYCDYFESYIEKNTYLVEIDAKKSFFVKVEAKHVAHIIDLHAFHDSAVRNKKIRFSGAFSFVFIREALLKGRWYSFDKSKCRKDTKLNPKYVASYNVGEIFYNFCISEDDENNCFCISNIVVYKNNSWVENQELLVRKKVIHLIPRGLVIIDI